MTPIRRCGSHALRLRLNLSPDFYSPYPMHIVDFMPLVELYGNLQNDEAYFQSICRKQFNLGFRGDSWQVPNRAGVPRDRPRVLGYSPVFPFVGKEL